MRIDRLQKEYQVEIRWTAFPLHPEIPEEGITLEELFAGRPIDINEMMLRLEKVAADLGLPLGERRKTYNSRLAQELAKWAESKGKGDSCHQAVFRAYFVDGKNIAKADELIHLAESIGLPAKEAKSVLALRSFKDAVDADWTRSREQGIRAVPTFLIDSQAVVGAQPYEVLEEFLKNCGIKRRKDPV